MVSTALAKHIKDVHEDRRKKCPHCAKSLRGSALHRHIQDVHEDRRKECPHCAKSLRGHNLHRHIQEVHGGMHNEKEPWEDWLWSMKGSYRKALDRQLSELSAIRRVRTQGVVQVNGTEIKI